MKPYSCQPYVGDRHTQAVVHRPRDKVRIDHREVVCCAIGRDVAGLAGTPNAHDAQPGLVLSRPRDAPDRVLSLLRLSRLGSDEEIGREVIRRRVGTAFVDQYGLPSVTKPLRNLTRQFGPTGV